MKKICSAILLMAMTMTVSAQSGTNSPYSQYGLGIQSDQTSGFNRGMGGLGLGFRDGGQVNFINPASYSGVDSLAFIFDVGMSGQITNFKENGVKKNAKNADFEYAVAAFRLLKHVGMSFGIVPLTNVGYKYVTAEELNDSRTTFYQNFYTGSGGLHQVYLGAGWEPFKGLSLGANVGYVWGDITRSIQNAYYTLQNGSLELDGTINTLTKVNTASASAIRLNFGAQYELPLGKKDAITVGATFSPSHSLGAEPTCVVTSQNSSSGVINPTSYTVDEGLKMPMMIGAGVMVNHHGQLRLGADYSFQQWSGVSFPEYHVVNDVPSYVLNSDYFMDRHKLTVGGEFCKGVTDRKFINRIRYRAGVSYSTPYYKINGADGPKEISVSAGFGIPIINGWNNRSGLANISLLNISGQWSHQSAGKGLLSENTFRINIGITFNERWFAKWKVQ
jgi:hypothetical protein